MYTKKKNELREYLSITKCLEEKMQSQYEEISDNVSEFENLRKEAIASYGDFDKVKAIESFLDYKIVKMHEKMKICARDLGLKEYRIFYLDQQTCETDYYSKHPELVAIQQG